MAVNMAATSCQRQRYYEDGHRQLDLPNQQDEVDDARCYGPLKWRYAGSKEKRKSAVELLRETKPLYIKSEMVLDGEQESYTNSNDTPILQLPLILPSPPPPPSSPLLPSFSRKAKFEFPRSGTDTNSASTGIVNQLSTVTTNCSNNADTNITTTALSQKVIYSDGNKTTFQGCVDETNDAGPSSNHDPQSFSHRTPSTMGTSADRCDDVSFAVLRSTRLIQPPPAFRKSASSSRLQNKLRKLLVSDSMEKVSDEEADADKNSIARHEITPNEDQKKSAVGSSNSQVLSNNEVNISCGVNNFFGKSLPDLTCVAVQPKYARPLPYSTSSDSHAREKWSLTQDVSWASYDTRTQHISPLVKKCENLNEKENERDGRLRNDDGNSLLPSPDGSCFSYITPPPLYCDDAGQLESVRRRLLVARSQSDVGDARNPKTDVVFGVELSTNPVQLIDSPNLNTFFDNLGFDSDEFSSVMATRSNTSSPVYLECDGDSSSVESVGGRGSDDENTPKDQTSAAAKSLSIVERNARIIKWLCNCRKAFETLRRFTPMPQSR